MTVEQLLLIVSAVLIPSLGAAVYVVSRISRLEVEIRSLSQLGQIENKTLDNRISKLEKHVHDIRNYLQTLSLFLVKGGYGVPKIDITDDDDTKFMQL